jgi:hypothetical protein
MWGKVWNVSKQVRKCMHDVTFLGLHCASYVTLLSKNVFEGPQAPECFHHGSTLCKQWTGNRARTRKQKFRYFSCVHAPHVQEHPCSFRCFRMSSVKQGKGTTGTSNIKLDQYQSVSICVWVCLSMYMCLSVWLCICACVRLYVWVCVCVCVCVCLSMCLSVYICFSVCVWLCMCVWVYVCVSVFEGVFWTWICVWLCLYVYVHFFVECLFVYVFVCLSLYMCVLSVCLSLRASVIYVGVGVGAWRCISLHGYCVYQPSSSRILIQLNNRL